MNAPEKVTPWTPRAGGLAHRVLDFLTRNPDEELYTADIAKKFEVDSTSVQSALIGGVQAGAIVAAKDEKGRRVYRLGTYAARPSASPFQAAAGAPEVPTVEYIQSLPVERIPFPDAKRRRDDAVGALRLKLMELDVEQCVPVSPAIKPLLSRAMRQIGDRTFKVRKVSGREYCWRLA
jgi:hypothetical protein